MSSSSSNGVDDDMSALSQELQQQATTIICRGNLPKAAVEDLKKWLFQHFNYPYPNDVEKEKLMAQTGKQQTLTVLCIQKFLRPPQNKNSATKKQNIQQ